MIIRKAAIGVCFQYLPQVSVLMEYVRAEAVVESKLLEITLGTLKRKW